MEVLRSGRHSTNTRFFFFFLFSNFCLSWFLSKTPAPGTTEIPMSAWKSSFPRLQENNKERQAPWLWSRGQRSKCCYSAPTLPCRFHETPLAICYSHVPGSNCPYGRPEAKGSHVLGARVLVPLQLSAACDCSSLARGTPGHRGTQLLLLSAGKSVSFRSIISSQEAKLRGRWKDWSLSPLLKHPDLTPVSCWHVTRFPDYGWLPWGDCDPGLSEMAMSGGNQHPGVDSDSNLVLDSGTVPPCTGPLMCFQLGKSVIERYSNPSTLQIL